MQKVREYWVALLVLALVELAGSGIPRLMDTTDERVQCPPPVATLPARALPRPVPTKITDDSVITIQIPLSAAVSAGLTNVQLDPVAQE